MKIIIDPGHGGTDPGASAFGVNEKDWALKLSLYQFRRFKELGIQVELTRHIDVTLYPVTRIAKVKNKADICLSNHFNAFNGTVRGIEVIHSIHSNATLSQRIARHLVTATELPLRRVFSRKIAAGRDYYYMHRLTGNTRTIIIEYGFLDNKADFSYFNNESHLYEAAEAVIKAICEEKGIIYKSDKDNMIPHDVSVKKNDAAGKKETHFNSSQKLVSLYDGDLRFYIKPSWEDQDVYGHMKKGQFFTTILDKVTVGEGVQYKVKNSKNEIYYVTAHPKFVKII